MRNKTIMFFCLPFLMALLINDNSYAGSSLSLISGIAMPSGDFKTTSKSSLGIGLEYEVSIGEKWSLAFSAKDYFGFDNKMEDATWGEKPPTPLPNPISWTDPWIYSYGESKREGKDVIIPLGINLRFSTSKEKPFIFFVDVGPEVSFVKFADYSYLFQYSVFTTTNIVAGNRYGYWTTTSHIRSSGGSKTRFGGNLGAGISYALSDNLLGGIEGRYSFISSGSGEIEYYAYSLKLTYKFGESESYNYKEKKTYKRKSDW